MAFWRALYSIRHDPDTYTTHLINGRWDPSKPVLVAPRTYAQSPFPSERGAVYFGGHDANFAPSTERAWIFKADPGTVLSGASAEHIGH
ncbi:hypothetical protein [Haloferula sp. A504]|uniref:hypothetical protein n=1 Tax=Haloferula sp. A504 TaxID=3373601 RepID=UPI0031CBD5B3|nr:hypothetical protein [Verrucomicrobiaceae bacterium E54]